MIRKPSLRIGLCLILLSLCFLCSSSLSFGQQPRRLRSSTTVVRRASGVLGCDATVGCWSSRLDMQRAAVHAIVVPATAGMDPDCNANNLCGKVLVVDRLPAQGSEQLWDAYDLSSVNVPLTVTRCSVGTGATQYRSNDPVGGTTIMSIYCAGHSALADGRVLFTGGRIYHGTTPEDDHVHGPLENFWFNPFANLSQAPYGWEQVGCSRRFPGTPARNGGRYYPTNVSCTLPGFDDTVLTFSGTDVTGVDNCTAAVNNTVERFNRNALPPDQWTDISWQVPIDVPPQAPGTCDQPVPLRYPSPGLYPRLHWLM